MATTPIPQPGESKDERYAEANQTADRLYREAEEMRDSSSEWREIPKLMQFLRGKQYSAKWPDWMASPVINRVGTMYWEEVSQLTDLRLYAGSVYPSRKTDQPYIDAAQALTDTLYAWWLDTDADAEFKSVCCYAMLSTGYGKVQWNSRARHGMGDFELLPLGMDRCMPVHPGRGGQDAEAWVIEDRRSLRWFRKHFPQRGSIVRPDFSGPEVAGKGMERRGGGTTGASGTIGTMLTMMGESHTRGMPGGSESNLPGPKFTDRASYQEFWIEDDSVNELSDPVIMCMGDDPDSLSPWCYVAMPGEPLYPRKRLIVRGSRTVLYDDGGPYFDGQFPIVDLRFNSVPWSWAGMSEIRPWISIQETINELMALYLQMLRKQLRPPFISPKRAVDDQTLMNMNSGRPDEKVTYNQNAAQPPRYEAVPGPPATTLAVISLLSRELDRTSGIGAANEMMAKKQAPAGEAFDRMRYAQSTPLRLKERVIEIFMRNVARLAISRICQFYTEKRLFYSGGEKAGRILWNPETLSNLPFEKEDQERADERAAHIREFLKTKQYSDDIIDHVVQTDSRSQRMKRVATEFGLYIKQGSVLDFGRAERLAVAMRLRMMQAISLKTLYRKLDVDVDSEAEMQQIVKEQATMEGAAAAAGVVLPQPGQRVSKSSHQSGQGKVVPGVQPGPQAGGVPGVPLG